MSWDGDLESREYQCEKVATDRAKDLALLRVRPIEGADPLVPAHLATADTPTGAVELVHHPQCKRKQATEGCHVLAVGATASSQTTEFTHDCDSEGGSSGAPLFDQQGVMVGLHHAGFARDAQTCKPIDKVNRGVRLDEVRAFVASARQKVDGGGAP
jgi:S1-C subfamily serine protease